MPIEQKIIDKLNSSALIIRKYNLGDKTFFIDKFKHVHISMLENAWEFGSKKIQNREIIKDASSLELQENKSAQSRFDNFEQGIQKVYNYLESDFDVKKLKLKEENIERHFRHLLAERYVHLEIYNILEIKKKGNIHLKEKIANFFYTFLFIIIIIGIVGFLSVPRIIDRLTPVGTLTERIHEKSKYKFSGAICNDGWTSHSQGRGTCSYHNGVGYYFYKGNYSKSFEQCRKEAMKISWFAP